MISVLIFWAFLCGILEGVWYHDKPKMLVLHSFLFAGGYILGDFFASVWKKK